MCLGALGMRSSGGAGRGSGARTRTKRECSSPGAVPGGGACSLLGVGSAGRSGPGARASVCDVPPLSLGVIRPVERVRTGFAYGVPQARRHAQGVQGAGTCEVVRLGAALCLCQGLGEELAEGDQGEVVSIACEPLVCAGFGVLPQGA